MNEYDTVYQFFGGMIAVAVYTLFWMLGGRSGKWLRRYLGTSIFGGAVNVLVALRGIWDPWILGVIPLLMIGSSMGYGEDSFWPKVARRTLFAAGNLAAGVLMAYVLGAWWVLIPHVGVGLWSVYLGVKNPIEAAAEEGMICALLSIGLIAYPFVV